MKLTDLLQEVGRPIAYYPSLNAITGSVNATLLITQLLYWHERASDPEHWIYKTHLEINVETGLSRDEQRTARANLKRVLFLREKRSGMPSRLYFQVDVDAINTAWELHKGGFPHNEGGKPQSVGGISPPERRISPSINNVVTESTTEITQRVRRSRANPVPEDFRPRPEDISVIETEHPTVNWRTETKKFIDYDQAKGPLWKNHYAAWRNWMRNARSTPSQPSGGCIGMGRGDGRMKWCDACGVSHG